MRHSSLSVLLLASLLASSAHAQKTIDDERARRAWSYLLDTEREDVLARFEGEVELLGTLQSRLAQSAAATAEVDAGVAESAAPTPYFDPELHAPAQPIPRRWLALDAPQAKKQRERMLGAAFAASPRETFRYDWGSRKVLRVAAREDRDASFENALAGREPRFDWAAAWVERALDGGAHQKTFAAFEHAYADRSGNVFPGLTLYDAWASGAEMEMPDVDSLGLVHELLDNWKSWVAPVPDTKHKQLYGAIGKLFVPAHRYRGVREALARTYLSGSPALRDGYDAQLDRLHALWHAYGSKPAELAARVPSDDQVAEFLSRWTLECEENEKVRDAGHARRAALDADRVATRALLLQILTETGAFERTAKPAADKSAK